MSRIAFVFPGQGSQLPGMGRSLAETYAEARNVFRLADRVLGMPLSRLCFEGSEAELSRTEVTQPAVLAVSVAALRVLEARGAGPQATAGHSLGEWTAHVCAGTLRFEEALLAVRARARLMQEAVPVGEGAMAAILGLDRAAVEEICAQASRGEVVSAANYNGPGQVVISGRAAAVGRAVALALASGARRAVPLPVSAPFHCALMVPAERGLASALENVHFDDPKVPVYANVTAQVVADAGEARELLLRQVSSPVRWQELVEAMVADGLDTFVEVGPGRVLSSLIRRIAPRTRVLGVSDPRAVEAAVRELGVAA